MLAVGTVPAVVVGLTFKDAIEQAFDHVAVVLVCMAATGVWLWRTRGVMPQARGIGVRVALLVGCAQAVAILPGCSRSGWTIATALMLGVAPAESARFSFLLSIPAILGATVLELSELSEPVQWGPLLAAVVLAGVVGFLCLGWLVRLVRGMQLHRFAYYLWSVAVVGGLVLALRQG
jgi:undecaprenyl-diphosphatase